MDRATGTLTYCNAGHPPPVIKRGTSEPLLLAANSPVIGAFPYLNFEEEQTVLEKDNVLVLYTDGVIEARCDGGFFGEERLIKRIKDMGPISATQLPQPIFKAVIEYTQNKLSDDLAILAVSLRPG
ncbi:MAG: PP2C family protein-serine/threonine phosphatase [Candidatus Aquicultor sp.]